MKLFEILTNLKTQEEFEIFFKDLCTDAEIEKMEQRVECAQLLLEGDTYNEVIGQIDISSATLSRVSRCIRYGSGGYNKYLREMLADKAKEEQKD